MKKAFTNFFSAVLALALIIGCLTTAYAETAAETPAELDIWDGTVADSFAGGTGTQDDPYIIETPEQLALMLNTFGDSKYYELAKDIYLNDVTAEDWYTAETNKEWFNGYASGNVYKYYDLASETTSFFNGNIDGNGHTVYGLWYKDDTASVFSGLIPSVHNAEIVNLSIDKAYVAAKQDAAAFVGANGRGSNSGALTFDSCYAGDDIVIKSTSSNAAAGFVGDAQGKNSILIESCYSLVPAENLSNAGNDYKKNAFLGEPWNTEFKISNCYCIGEPFDSNNNAAMVSTLAAEGYSDIYATAAAEKLDADYYTTVSAEDMQGNAAVTNMAALGNKFVTVDGGYPTLKAFVFGTDTDIWGGFITAPADADENGEYEIYNAEELAWYVKNGGNAKLMNDIYLNDMKVTVSNGTATMTKLTDETVTLSAGDTSLREWYGTGTSLGTADAQLYVFNGNGYAVNGLYYNRLSADSYTSNRFGLFNFASSGTDIKGLGIENCYMLTGNKYSAACIIGYVNKVYYTISECYLAESVYHESSTTYAGGIVGGGNVPDDGTKPAITDCISLATLKSTGTPHAISSYWTANGMSITRCFAANGHTAYNKASATDVYHNIADNSTIQGASALDAMPGLSTEKMYAVKSEGKFPMLRVRGTAIGDVNEDGVGLATGDDEALRKALIGTAEALNGNFNKDESTDILDLVALTLAKK